MKYRKLRIAFSAACGVFCLLLIALWVRSYWWIDEVYIGRSYPAVCGWGDLYYKPIMHFNNSYQLHVSEHDFGPIRIDSTWNGDGPLVFRIDGFALPIWTLLLPIAAIAILPWLPWRFSLRTLLIATTLVAVVLGLIVYAVR